MTARGRFPSGCFPQSPPVTIHSERFAPVCSSSALQLSLAPSTGLLTASRTAVALPLRPVRLRDRTCGSIPTIGSSPQTR
jgi:hypothetical protein